MKQVTVPWASLGLFARATVHLGALARVDAQGGPWFPLVRRTFLFEDPETVIHEVPTWTWALRSAPACRFGDQAARIRRSGME